MKQPAQAHDQPSRSDADSISPFPATFAVFGYNQEAYITEAVRGAFAQSFEPLEIILIDDGSHDDTPRVMANLAASYRGAAKLRLVVNESNMGYADSVSKVMEIASGEIVILAGGDDISYPNRTRTIVEAWKQAGKPPVCLHSLANTMNADGYDRGKTQGAWNLEALSNPEVFLKHGGSMLGATAACPRSLFKCFGPFTVSGIGNTEDVALSFRSALLGGALYIAIPLLLYRVGTGISTQQYENQKKPDRIAQALSRLDQSMACTKQMESDLKIWSGEPVRLQRLLHNRQLVLQCSKASYISRVRAFISAGMVIMDAIFHEGLALRRVFAKAVYRALSGRF